MCRSVGANGVISRGDGCGSWLPFGRELLRLVTLYNEGNTVDHCILLYCVN